MKVNMSIIYLSQSRCCHAAKYLVLIINFVVLCI